MPENDIIEILERDHRRISDLAERLDSVSDDDEIRDLYRQIVDGLLAHEAIEDEVLFPAYRKMLHDGAAAPLEERLGEHEELNEMLAEMRDLDAHDFAFVKRGSALLLELERHFELEEGSVFARMREELPEAELIELGRRAMAAGDAPAE
jgi:iron-sulfur cluster repair protein YtfE (RIC family)